MKTVLVFFTFFLFTTSLLGQSFEVEWDRYYYMIGDQESIGAAVLTTPENNIVISGFDHITDMYGSCFIMKIDSEGNPGWTTEFGASTSQRLNNTIIDSDHNFVSVGYNYYSYGILKTYFVKVSQDGELICRTLNSERNWGKAYDVEQTNYGDYLVAADSLGFAGIRRVNNAGFFQNDTVLFPGRFSAMEKANDNEFVLTGYISGNGTKNIVLTKLKLKNDSIFELVMNKTFPEDGVSEWGSDILVLPNEQGFIICGYGEGGIILRVDMEGQLIWKKTFVPSAKPEFGFKKVLLDNDQHVLVLAGSIDTVNNIMILKYDLSGNLIQSSYFNFNTNDLGTDITKDQDGYIYLTGASISWIHIQDVLLSKIKDMCRVETPNARPVDSTFYQDENVIIEILNTSVGWNYSLMQLIDSTILATTAGNGSVIEIDAGRLTIEAVSEGLIVTATKTGKDCVFTSDILFFSLFDGIENNPKAGFQIIPNPFHDYITISNISNINTFSVFDLNGRIVVEETIVSENQRIDLTEFPKGIYLLKVTDQSGKSFFQKAIKN